MAIERKRMLRVCALAVLLVAAWGVDAPASAQSGAGAGAAGAPDYLQKAALPDAVTDLLYARPFTLEEPYVYTWLRGQPEITAGLLLVLEVDPIVARPRQVDVPVLFAGDTPVHLTNTGFPGGRMVVVVPDWIDPRTDPFYFGSTELPETIDRAAGRAELELARLRGAAPFTPERVDAAFAAAGAPLEVRDAVALMRAAADLIDVHAPDEAELAEIYRTPMVSEQ